MKRIVLIDLSTTRINLSEDYKQILSARLKAENNIIWNNIGVKCKRGLFNYSRGLLLIASALVKKGYNVKYCLYSDESDRKNLNRLLGEADLVGFTSITSTIELAAELSVYAKKVNSKLISVVGGAHASAIPEHTLKEFPAFDFAVSGRGENVLPELICNLDKGKYPSNITFRDKDNNIHCSKGNELKNSDINEGLPAYTLLNRRIDEYAHNIRTQEGCPYNCKFCVDRFSWTQGEKQRSPESILKELDLLYEACVKNTVIHLSDSIVNIDPNRFRSLCELLKKYSDKFIYSIDTRYDLVSPGFVKIASDSGIKYFRLGATDVQNSLIKSCKRSSSIKKLIEASSLIKKFAKNSVVHLYWMTGLPGSTFANLEESALAIEELIRNKHVDIVGNRLFVPYPGTEYYSNPSKYGITLLGKSWRLYDRLSPPVYKLQALTDSQLYNQFIETEKKLLEAYMSRDSRGPLKSFEEQMSRYVYSNYIR